MRKIDLFCMMLFCISLASLSHADVYCIQNQNDLDNALQNSVNNGEDDVLQIVQGVELNNFILPKELGYLIKIRSGFSKDCLSRLSFPAAPSKSEQKVISQENLTPQQNTTGPTPPPQVESKEEIFSVQDYSGGSDVTVLGVPGYAWRHGCGPTSVGMVVGYWDIKGYSDLFPGSATTQTDDVNQGIASEGSLSASRHYEDYSLPEDSSPTLLADKSELPAGDEHPNDSIADFMKTSWSSENNYYGWSWSNDIIPAFSNYTQLRNSSYVVSGTSYYFGSTLTWEVLTNEIDAQRPLVFLVDSSGDGDTDHFVTVVGYRLDGTTQYYGCLDTWYPYDTIRWVQFRGMSSSYPWGIWSGYSFQLSHTATKNQDVMPILNFILNAED